MTDPTYQYIKGLGWQPFPNFESVEITTHLGEQYRLEARTPQIGDKCIWGWSGSNSWSIDHTSKPNLATFAAWLSVDSNIEEGVKVCNATLMSRLANTSIRDGEQICWVTVVKL